MAITVTITSISFPALFDLYFQVSGFYSFTRADVYQASDFGVAISHILQRESLISLLIKLLLFLSARYGK